MNILFWYTLPMTRKQKYTFLSDILWKIQIDQNERDLYILALEILSDDEFEIFYNKIILQIENDDQFHTNIHRKTIAPLSSNII